jgi:hypothetical protein
MAPTPPSRAASIEPQNKPPDKLAEREQRNNEARNALINKEHITREDEHTVKLFTTLIRKLICQHTGTVAKERRDMVGHAVTLLEEVVRKKDEEMLEREMRIRVGMAEEEEEDDDGEEEGEIRDKLATKNSVDDLKSMVMDMAEQLKDVKKYIMGNGSPLPLLSNDSGNTPPTQHGAEANSHSQQTSRPLYSFAARQGMNPTRSQTQSPSDQLTVERARARRELMSRQVLISIPDSDAFLRIVKDSEVGVILRSRTIIKEILPNENLEDFTIRAVKFMRGRDILLEVKTAKAAAKLREKDIMTKYAEAWAPEATIVPRLTTVIAMFVPVTLDVNGTNTISQIESTNGLKAGTNHSISWCRTTPFHKEQRVALLKIQLTVRAAANYLATHHMTIEHKRVKVRMDAKDPLQCLKCYRWAHTAQRCKGNEVCGRCGRDHQTSTCTSPDSDKHCVSCNTNDHCSTDRSCPVYRKQKELMALRDPDSTAALYSLTKEEADIEFLEIENSAWDSASWNVPLDTQVDGWN